MWIEEAPSPPSRDGRGVEVGVQTAQPDSYLNSLAAGGPKARPPMLSVRLARLSKEIKENCRNDAVVHWVALLKGASSPVRVTTRTLLSVRLFAKAASRQLGEPVLPMNKREWEAELRIAVATLVEVRS